MCFIPVPNVRQKKTIPIYSRLIYQSLFCLYSRLIYLFDTPKNCRIFLCFFSLAGPEPRSEGLLGDEIHDAQVVFVPMTGFPMGVIYLPT